MSLGSGIREKPIPDPGVKKAPDPGSATLRKMLLFLKPPSNVSVKKNLSQAKFISHFCC
jgi:hypothetical protein